MYSLSRLLCLHWVNYSFSLSIWLWSESPVCTIEILWCPKPIIWVLTSSFYSSSFFLFSRVKRECCYRLLRPRVKGRTRSREFHCIKPITGRTEDLWRRVSCFTYTVAPRRKTVTEILVGTVMKTSTWGVRQNLSGEKLQMHNHSTFVSFSVIGLHLLLEGLPDDLWVSGLLETQWTLLGERVFY